MTASERSNPSPAKRMSRSVGTLPLVPGFADFSLDAAFFVKKTAARAQRIGRIAKELKTVQGDGNHVLAYAFSSNGSGPPLLLHIDESKYEKEPASYYVQIHLHDGKYAEKPAKSRNGADWAMDQLVALGRGSKLLFFFDADMEIEGEVPLPSAVIAPPLTVGGKTLSVVGVEYGAPVQVNGVDGFRWTLRENGLRLRVSYTKELAISMLPTIWERERATVEGYVREVFPR